MINYGSVPFAAKLALHLFLVLPFLVLGSEQPTGVFYADNGLKQTIAYPLYGSEYRDEFRDEILELLGLDHEPHPRNGDNLDTSASLFMLNLYRNSLHGEQNGLEALSPRFRFLSAHPLEEMMIAYRSSLFDYSIADTIMSFSDKKNDISSPISSFHTLVPIYFDTSDVSPLDLVLGAELKLLRNASSASIGDDGEIKVYMVEVDRNGQESLRLLANQSLAATSDAAPSRAQITMNITEALEFWQHYPHRNYGLMLEATDSLGRPMNPRNLGIRNSFMVGLLKTGQRPPSGDSERKKRRKRATSFGAGTTPYDPVKELSEFGLYSQQMCQRHALYVSFRDLNWEDWIIAPHGYSAFYCHGECTFPLHSYLNATNHAIVQALVNVLDPSIPTPQCAPTGYDRVTILYFDDYNNVVMKVFPKMIVTQCGCH